MEDAEKIHAALTAAIEDVETGFDRFKEEIHEFRVVQPEEFRTKSKEFMDHVAAAREEFKKPAMEDSGVGQGERHTHILQRLGHISLDEQTLTVKWGEAEQERQAEMLHGAYGLFSPGASGGELPPRPKKKYSENDSKSPSPPSSPVRAKRNSSAVVIDVGSPRGSPKRERTDLAAEKK